MILDAVTADRWRLPAVPTGIAGAKNRRVPHGGVQTRAILLGRKCPGSRDMVGGVGGGGGGCFCFFFLKSEFNGVIRKSGIGFLVGFMGFYRLGNLLHFVTSSHMYGGDVRVSSRGHLWRHV